jgi:hypothetical protein
MSGEYPEMDGETEKRVAAGDIEARTAVDERQRKFKAWFESLERLNEETKGALFYSGWLKTLCEYFNSEGIEFLKPGWFHPEEVVDRRESPRISETVNTAVLENEGAKVILEPRYDTAPKEGLVAEVKSLRDRKDPRNKSYEPVGILIINPWQKDHYGEPFDPNIYLLMKGGDSIAVLEKKRPLHALALEPTEAGEIAKKYIDKRVEAIEQRRKATSTRNRGANYPEVKLK